MDPGRSQSSHVAPQVELSDLLDLCRILNAAGVGYAVYGRRARMFGAYGLPPESRARIV